MSINPIIVQILADAIRDLMEKETFVSANEINYLTKEINHLSLERVILSQDEVLNPYLKQSPEPPSDFGDLLMYGMGIKQHFMDECGMNIAALPRAAIEPSHEDEFARLFAANGYGPDPRGSLLEWENHRQGHPYDPSAFGQTTCPICQRIQDIQRELLWNDFAWQNYKDGILNVIREMFNDLRLELSLKRAF